MVRSISVYIVTCSNIPVGRSFNLAGEILQHVPLQVTPRLVFEGRDAGRGSLFGMSNNYHLYRFTVHIPESEIFLAASNYDLCRETYRGLLPRRRSNAPRARTIPQLRARDLARPQPQLRSTYGSGTQLAPRTCFLRQDIPAGRSIADAKPAFFRTLDSHIGELT
jgi:hypothetical protein